MSIFLQALFFKSKITTWIMAVLFFGMMQHGAASDFAKYTQIGDNIAHPWGMDYLNDQMMLVTGREDGLFSINMTDDTTRQIGGLPRDVMVGGQGGWLDILVDSRQNQHNRIYLCYSRQGQNPRTASTAVLTGIINQDQLEQIDMIFTANNPSKARNHYGCRLALIKDHLYVSVGDRTQRDLAQDVAAHAGSVIEIDLPVDSAFRPDLPSRVFSKGHRNPQGMIYYAPKDQLWLVEHGPRGGDEFNIVKRGKNYGWPLVTQGKEYIGFDIGEDKNIPGFTDPLWVWVPSIAPSGMDFYDPSMNMFPELKNHLLVGALVDRAIVAVKLDDSVMPISESKYFNNKIGRIRDIMVQQDGSILLLNDEVRPAGLFKLFR